MSLVLPRVVLRWGSLVSIVSGRRKVLVCLLTTPGLSACIPTWPRPALRPKGRHPLRSVGSPQVATGGHQVLRDVPRRLRPAPGTSFLRATEHRPVILAGRVELPF